MIDINILDYARRQLIIERHIAEYAKLHQDNYDNNTKAALIEVSGHATLRANLLYAMITDELGF